MSELKAQVFDRRNLSDPSHMHGLPNAEIGLSRWNFSTGKRVFDVTVGAVVLTLAMPLMALIAMTIRVSTRGPVLFRQRRVGRNGKLFEILKFRTMVHRSLQDQGTSITRRGDSRVTWLGRWLRKSKLDELPQLYNVVRGDMSLVGPRPDLPEFYDNLGPEQRQILALKPGVTGWATLQFRDEESHLARVPEQQLTSYYVDTLFPAKVQLALDYARRATFTGDLLIILRTFIGP
jgi:lipopolysaccharide/colanic/teichoic acid biosynthesis glycosyltransferase